MQNKGASFVADSLVAALPRCTTNLRNLVFFNKDFVKRAWYGKVLRLLTLFDPRKSV
jgi:hypothetical protein